MAALMTSEINDSDRIYLLLEEGRRMGIKLLPPDVNESEIDFAVVDGNIRFGLQAVKNVGQSPARAIAEERHKSGPFNDMADLVSRVPPRCLNRRTLESLIAAGACDSLPGNRAQKTECVEAMTEFGRKVFEESDSHDLFAGSSGVIERVAPELPPLQDWSSTDKLAREKQMLGFFISGHPLDRFRSELSCFARTDIAGLREIPDGREVTIGGIIGPVKTMIDKKGNMMAFAPLEDFSGSLEMVIFSSCYETCKEHIRPEQMVLTTGKVNTREGEAPKLIVSEVVPLEGLSERFDCQLVIKIAPECSDDCIDSALSILESSAGTTPVLLAARHNGTEVYIRSKKYSVRTDFELLGRLKEILGDASAYLRPLNRKEANT
jgi:DNA polymerase-3 subunit alpha